MNIHEVAHPSGQLLTVYEMLGPANDAPVLMLLHGLGGTALLNWKPVLELLSQHFRVLAVDHRGHGRGIRSRTCRFEDCADDVAVAVDAMQVGSVIVAGYSMGGPIALQLWRRHPEKVQGLVLIATATSLTHLRTIKFHFGLPVLAVIAMFYALRRRAYVSYLIKFVQNLVPGNFSDRELAQEFGGHQPVTLFHAVLSTIRFTVDWGREIDVPLVSLVTQEDEIVPPSLQRNTAAKAKQGMVMETPGGHQAIFSHSDQFRLQFLAACKKLQAGWYC